MQGFFRGMPTTLIRSFPVNAVTFSVVTWILRFEPLPESSSVTYQDASSLQESLVNTASFAHDHQVVGRSHQNEWLPEWKPFIPALMLGGIGPIGSVPIRNYTTTVNCRCTDWISSAMSSLVHLGQVHSIGGGINNNRPSPVTDTTGSTAGLLFSCHCQEAEEGSVRPAVQVSPGDSSFSTATAAAAAVCSACRTSSLSLSTGQAVRCAAHQAAASSLSANL